MITAIGSKRIRQLTAAMVAVILLAACGVSAQGMQWSRGEDSLVFTGYEPLKEKPPIPVHYYIPLEGDVTVMRVLFAMHGSGGDCKGALNNWKPYAERDGFIVIAPQYIWENSGWDYQSVGVKGNPREKWTGNTIEAIFDLFKKQNGSKAEQYDMFGHSAGGQFTHRFVLSMPNARIRMAVAANPSSWALPLIDGLNDRDGKVYGWPKSVKGSPFATEEEVKRYLAAPLILHQGNADTSTTDPTLDKSASAKAQGPYRFARGNMAFETARQVAEKMNTPFGWRRVVVDGVGHSSGGMIRGGKVMETGAYSLIFGKVSIDPKTVKSGQFVDKRDGKSYKTVQIGEQTWMAENLNYNANGSKCYKDSDDNCAKYGRLYDWRTAMNGAHSSSSSPSEIQGVCPAEWHVPSDREWKALVDVSVVGGSASGGGKLKSADGWKNDGNGTDDYKFSALPGGRVESGGKFSVVGNSGYWWSATEDSASHARIRGIPYNSEKVVNRNEDKTFMLSVRCVQDVPGSVVKTQTQDNGQLSSSVVNAPPSSAKRPLTASGGRVQAGQQAGPGASIHKSGADLYSQRGDAYMEKKNYRQAVSDYTESIRIDPDNANYYAKRGKAYEMLKDNRKAEADFQTARRLEEADAVIDEYIEDVDEIEVEPEYVEEED